MPPSSETVLARLKGLHPQTIDLSLERIERLLSRLGRPQDRLPSVVHVAGTNGKGSVIAFVRAILEAQGLRVHVFTSPHLIRFNERIALAGEDIDDAELTAILEECETANAGDPITFFEITTAATLLAFSRTAADITLLETGLGGRLDATNVVRRPALTALTPIAMDHQTHLGTTLEAIAYEKAGILKPGVLCVSAAQRPEAGTVVRERAHRLGAPVAWRNEAWNVQPAANGMLFEARSRVLNLPPPGLVGPHQVDNAGLAIACVTNLAGITVGDDAIRRGLATVQWPARLQRLASGRLRSLLPQDWELWLDGGHNPAAGEALARHVRSWHDRPLFLVFGMLQSKDAAGFLAPLSPLVTEMATVAIPGETASLDPDEAARVGATLGITGKAASGIHDALARLGSAASGRGPARVLVCGSLYLAGAVLAENEPPPFETTSRERAARV